MKILPFFVLFLFIIFPNKTNSQYEGWRSPSQYEREKYYKNACELGELPNCYQLGLFYLEQAKKLKGEDKKNKELEGKKIIKDSCSKGEVSACEFLKGGILAGEGSTFLFWASIILIGLATLIITRTIFQEEDEYKTQEQLENNSSSKNEFSKYGVILKYSRPFFRRYITPIVLSMKGKNKIKEKYKRKLATAGLSDILTPEDFFSFKLFLIVGFPLIYVGVRAFLEEDWPLKLIPVVGFIGYIYPNIWINKMIEKRKKAITLAMPFAVDMLALSVEAGLDFMAAIKRVVDKAKHSPLIDEFNHVLKDVQIGASRAEALRSMSWRTDLVQMSSFCAALISADSVGASIAPILKSLSIEMRVKRGAEIEKEGAKAAGKLLLPTIFLIVPAVLVVVITPLIIGFIVGR